MGRSMMTNSVWLSVLFLYGRQALRLNVGAWPQEQRHRLRTSQIFFRMAADDSLTQAPSPSISVPPSSIGNEPTILSTQTPTLSPSFSTQHFLDLCGFVSSYYDSSTCDCSTEDGSITCELPGSDSFPFQYVLFQYNEMTGMIEKGSECYCENEVNCGNNPGDYCLSMTLVGQQICAIKFLQDGAQCSNSCVPCLDDMNSYGVNIDGCFSGGAGYGCLRLEIDGSIGENHDRSLAPPDFSRACDEVSSTYPNSECRCYVGDLRMDCSQDSTTNFGTVFLSFFYDDILTKITDGAQCFCESDDCGAGASDYCIETTLVGDPVCNITYLQTNVVYDDCCEVCNSEDLYGVNKDQCSVKVAESIGCFTIGIDKATGENHALGQSGESFFCLPCIS
jgi:hypothetical protein